MKTEIEIQAALDALGVYNGGSGDFIKALEWVLSKDD